MRWPWLALNDAVMDLAHRSYTKWAEGMSDLRGLGDSPVLTLGEVAGLGDEILDTYLALLEHERDSYVEWVGTVAKWRRRVHRWRWASLVFILWSLGFGTYALISGTPYLVPFHAGLVLYWWYGWHRDRFREGFLARRERTLSQYQAKVEEKLAVALAEVEQRKANGTWSYLTHLGKPGTI